MLHVTLLGEQAITDDGAGVQTRSSRAVALVAFLVAHVGVPQPRQRIAGMFWPDSTDAQALTNLRRELHHLRQALGDDRSLVVTPRNLCWRDSGTCRVDLRIFDNERQAALAAAAAGDDEGVLRHAAAAVAQYKGDLLPGVYDDWLLEARSELERRCADLCDLLSAARARTGDLAGAADAVRRRIQLQPLEEAGDRTLMLLQADLGDRAGAVSTYHHCASVLERELGVIPDPATRQAFRRLMTDGDPASARLPDLQPDTSRSGFAAAQLVGRLRELGLLQELWRAAAAGRPGLALVGGGAGVGKTRLVAEVAEAARRHGGTARWWRAASASEHRDGWPWRRWRTGCGTRPFRKRRPRQGRTSLSTCSLRRATSTPVPWQRRWTSCGAAGSCESSVTATTFPTISSAMRRTRRSARRSDGSCTGAWRRRSSCCTLTTRTRSRLSSRSSTPAAGGQGGPWPITDAPPAWQQACSPMPRRSGCTARPCRWCAECRREKTGTGGNSKSLRPWPHRSTPGTAIHQRSFSGPLERSINLAESLGRRDSTLTGLVALWATQFVQGRIADGYQTATRALTLVGPGSDLSGPAHFAVGGSAVSLGRPAEGLRHLELAAQLAGGAVWLSVGTRSDVQGTAFAAHAHWLLGHDAEALSARHDAIKMARAIGHPYCLAVALAYGSITHQMRHDLPELREMVGELRELCGRYGFAYYREWGLILDGWSRPDDSGIDLARQGIANLKAAGSFARWPYWLSLLADLLARNDRLDAARASLDAALAAGRQRDDLWWLPEVMRLRAAYDEPEAAISRLCSAAEMAAAHGSAGLLLRCEHDLGTRGVRTAPPSVLPRG